MEKRLCSRCNAAFVPSRGDKIYCSSSCSKSGPKGGRQKKVVTKRENTESRKLQSILSKKGASKEDYLALLSNHSNCCEICGKPSTEERFQRLCLDHCHSSGKLRGFLCAKCNSGLGMFKDDISLLLNAVKYLSLK